MAIPKTTVKIIKVPPPFKPLSSALVLTKKYPKTSFCKKFNISYLIEEEFSEDFKVTALTLALKLLKDFQENLKNLSSNVEIFVQVEEYLQQIPMEFYPAVVQEEYKELCDILNKMKSERHIQYLTLEAKKPKALRLYEPKIVDV